MFQAVLTMFSDCVFRDGDPDSKGQVRAGDSIAQCCLFQTLREAFYPQSEERLQFNGVAKAGERWLRYARGA